MKAIALIDGDHHPDVARDALDRLARECELATVLLIGGEEKLTEAALAEPERHFGFAIERAGDDPRTALREAALRTGASCVVDLAGEPALDGDGRMELAAVVLDLGLAYRAPGLELRPPPAALLDFGGPVIEVIGTGKRTGKTALAGHLARLLSQQAREPVVVAMGRGGPARPVLVRRGDAPGVQELLALARAGGHAASDYLEDAVVAGVSVVGCRRAGDGPAGETWCTNALEGARLAIGLRPDVLVLEGSGAALPPIAASRTACAVAATRTRDALSHLGPLRLLRSRLVVLTGAQALSPAELDRAKEALGRWTSNAEVIACRLEPEPLAPLRAGARVAVFTTAPADAEPEWRATLRRHGADVRLFASSLASRATLGRDVDRAAREGCDLFLCELKAAAIDVVAERAERLRIELAFLRNRPVALPGERDVDAALLQLAAPAEETLALARASVDAAVHTAEGART
jgi:cyclic 2,3-diphosphoglycerate synthase